MRELDLHKTNECNEAIEITANERNPRDGMSHHYVLRGPAIVGTVALDFQHGAIKEVGVNGITNEALLAVLIDRLVGAQSGPYRCDDNQYALNALRVALGHLKARTLRRVARGVEGTHEI